MAEDIDRLLVTPAVSDRADGIRNEVKQIESKLEWLFGHSKQVENSFEGEAKQAWSRAQRLWDQYAHDKNNHYNQVGSHVGTTYTDVVGADHRVAGLFPY